MKQGIGVYWRSTGALCPLRTGATAWHSVAGDTCDAKLDDMRKGPFGAGAALQKHPHRVLGFCVEKEDNM